MDALQERYITLGASVAGDGIPQDFGDLAAEYDAALNGAVLFDRSHEARLRLEGEDRYALIADEPNDVSPGREPASHDFTTLTAVARPAEVYAAETHASLSWAGPLRAASSHIQLNIFFAPMSASLSTRPRQFGCTARRPRTRGSVAPGASARPRSAISREIAGLVIVTARQP